MKSRNAVKDQETGASRPSDANMNGLQRHRKSPVVVGTGFLALDIVITERDEQHKRTWAGGTCGNVLAILAYLGWQAYPVSTLGMDAGADRLIADLIRFGVHVPFIRKDPGRRTPIVVEKIRWLANGLPRSRFIWTCPGCAAWFPSYKPVLIKDMRPILASMPDPAVFFFDRLSRGALDMAAASVSRGALVVFEPSGIGDPKLFREALALSHIVKYSHERMTGIGEMSDKPLLLEIETFGSEGLRYRRGGRAQPRKWQAMKAHAVSDVRDTVGAGDWCTAGLVHLLGAEGVSGMMNAEDADVKSSLQFGQALAALTCVYEGARGGMYAMDRRQFRSAIKGILDGNSASAVGRPDMGTQESWGVACPQCAKNLGDQPSQFP